MSPLTQGLRYRAACDMLKMSAISRNAHVHTFA